MPRGPGNTLTPAQKREKLAQLRRYIKTGMSYTEMADRLDVSVATIYTWKQMVLTQMLPEMIEEKIMQELVCCNIYEQAAPLRALRPSDGGYVEGSRRLRELMNKHPACYWGAAAAKIAQSFAEPR